MTHLTLLFIIIISELIHHHVQRKDAVFRLKEWWQKGSSRICVEGRRDSRPSTKSVVDSMSMFLFFSSMLFSDQCGCRFLRDSCVPSFWLQWIRYALVFETLIVRINIWNSRRLSRLPYPQLSVNLEVGKSTAGLQRKKFAFTAHVL